MVVPLPLCERTLSEHERGLRDSTQLTIVYWLVGSRDIERLKGQVSGGSGGGGRGTRKTE
jgi:hypothetical protein